MRSAVEVRHRSMFYLEVQVGSSDWETCNRIAASLVARRGENHLHRRYMVIRQRLYRGRFPSAYPPLLPPGSLRNLVSGAELAHLLELPSARMKGCGPGEAADDPAHASTAGRISRDRPARSGSSGPERIDILLVESSG